MSHAVQPEKTNISSSAAFWTVLIFVGLILGAVNFVKVMGGDEAHGGHGAPTEHGAPAAGHEEHDAHNEGHEAPAAHTEGHGAEATGQSHEAAAPAAGHTEAGHAAPETAQPAKEEAHH